MSKDDAKLGKMVRQYKENETHIACLSNELRDMGLSIAYLARGLVKYPAEIEVTDSEFRIPGEPKQVPRLPKLSSQPQIETVYHETLSVETIRGLLNDLKDSLDEREHLKRCLSAAGLDSIIR